MNERHIFINCPFDEGYQPLMKAIIFICIYFDLKPQLSDTADSFDIRVEGIIGLIMDSKYSIHDLSRATASKKGEVFRMNMPFELGIDVGVRVANSDYKDKRCIILEDKPYLTKQALSDIAGGDHAAHENDAQKLIAALRNWFITIFSPDIDSASTIWKAYLDFKDDLFVSLSAKGRSADEIENLTRREYIFFVENWFE